MHSHRRPRGRILFEALCALTVGASFVGAWNQTGASAFLGSAFVFTLFGLYWSLDMFRRGPVAAAVQPAIAPVAVTEPESLAASEPMTEVEQVVEPEVLASPEPVAARPKRRAKKAKSIEPVEAHSVEPAEPVGGDEFAHRETHIEPLFDPQPFARPGRPAFGKRPRGLGPKPLPAA